MAETAPVRSGEEFDLAGLWRYLRDRVDITEGEIEVEQFPAVISNLTYLVRLGTAEYVLRRPLFVNTVKTAYDMRREFETLSKLSAVYQPAPKPLLFCDDESIIGGPYPWTYGGSTGWIQLDIPDVPIEANVEYTVSVSTGASPRRNYPNVAADLLVAGGNGQHLTYPVNAGVFTETREARPTGSFNGGNYLRDVVFLPEGAEEPSTPIRIIEIKPDYVEAWNRRATIYYQKKDYNRSLADLRQVLAREPRHFGAIAGLALIMQDIGEDKRALDMYRKALEIYPRLPRIPDTVKTLSEKVEGRDI